MMLFRNRHRAEPDEQHGVYGKYLLNYFLETAWDETAYFIDDY